MKLPLYQVDAFTNLIFKGNPAAVCPLDDWLEDRVMQAIAAENNLSETAFMIDRGRHFDLRWFTPKAEIDLAGHPTLAAAYVVFEILKPNLNQVRFETRSGTLRVERRGSQAGYGLSGPAGGNPARTSPPCWPAWEGSRSRFCWPGITWPCTSPRKASRPSNQGWTFCLAWIPWG